jgi:ATP-dependent RNA helicase DHX29
MLELDNLRIAAGGGPGGKGKGGKKGKGNGVVLETPDMRRVKEKIGKMGKEYMFSRKDAGASRF